MDVLEYTEEQLNAMSGEELKALLHEAEDAEGLWDTKQMTEKIMINSLYGALANKWFPLFNEHMAAAITGNGRYFIQKSANYIEEALQKLLPQQKPYIVYGDTDSYYYHIEPFMEKYQKENPGLSINEYVDWADAFEKKVIQPVIAKSIEDFADELNAYNREKIGCEREIISDVAVFTAKKKYYARVRDSEGTRFPEDAAYTKVMGLEIVKSSTPIWSQKHLKEAIPHILDKDENDLRNWLHDIKQEFIKAPLTDISSVSGVKNVKYNSNDLDKNGKPKSINIGTKAAQAANEYIEKNGLQSKYSPIQNGDKTKRLFLQEPNPFGTNIVAYTNDHFVDEVYDYVDYDTQFEKNFLKPLEIMVQPMGWDLEKETASLDDW